MCGSSRQNAPRIRYSANKIFSRQVDNICFFHLLLGYMTANYGVASFLKLKKMTSVSPKHHITAMQLLYASKHKIRIEQKGDEQCIGKAEQ